MFETFLKYLGLYFKLFFFSLQQQTATFIMRQETKGLSSIFAKAGCRKFKKKSEQKNDFYCYSWVTEIHPFTSESPDFLTGSHRHRNYTDFLTLWLTSYFILLRKVPGSIPKHPKYSICSLPLEKYLRM